MTERAPDADWLSGQRVAFTGRLACMTSREAAVLVRRHGGTVVPSVNRQTSLLVVGQEGWPLGKDGRLTQKLQRARWLQRRASPIAICTEEELLARLGLDCRSEGMRRLYTTAELSRILDIRLNLVRAWIQAGFIRPAQVDHGISYFDFRQVSGAKTLSALVQAGVTKQRLERSLRQLKAWLPHVEQPLAQLPLLGSGGELLVRLDNGQLAEPTGQLVLDFEDSAGEATGTVLSTQPATAGEWLEAGCQSEAAGRLTEAVHAYRQALLIGGPDAAGSFNLGNALYALGQKEEASKRFYQAVELKPEFVQAWNNLGIVLTDLGRPEEAVAAFRRALEQDPAYADPHYNLADLLEAMGQAAAAHRHWQAYVHHDPQSAWGFYARQRLASTKPSQG
jgi:tetratricopeptide (TPR) repeat protein